MQLHAAWIWLAPLGVACSTSAPPKALVVPPSSSASTSASTKAVASAAPKKLPEGAVANVAKPMPTNAWPTTHWDVACGSCSSTIDEGRCERCGGKWDVGMLGVGHCACPTAEAGKPCRDERDCTSTACSLPWDVAMSHGKTQCNDDYCIGPGANVGLPWGQCADFQKTFGCQGWLGTTTTPNGLMRETRWICKD